MPKSAVEVVPYNSAQSVSNASWGSASFRVEVVIVSGLGNGHFPQAIHPPRQFTPGQFTPQTIHPPTRTVPLPYHSKPNLTITYIHTCMHTFIHIYVHAYTHRCMQTHIYTYNTYMHTYIQYIHACIYTYIQSYIITYFGIHTYILSQG